MLGFSLPLHAVPAVPWAIEKIQPDGSKVYVFLKGDEYLHWMESVDGYTLMYDTAGYIVYAQVDPLGHMIPSNIKFSNNIKPHVDIQKGLRYSKAQMNTLRQIEYMAEKVNGQNITSGNLKFLCILAEFSDRPLVKTKAEFEILMNQTGYSANGANGSVKDFYLKNSYGALNLQISVVGPVTLP